METWRVLALAAVCLALLAVFAFIAYLAAGILYDLFGPPHDDV